MSYLLVLTCTRWRVLVTWHRCRMRRMRATRNKLTKQSSIKCFHNISMATIVHRHLYLFICGSGSCTFTPDKITWEIVNYTWACSYIYTVYIHSSLFSVIRLVLCTWRQVTQPTSTPSPSQQLTAGRSHDVTQAGLRFTSHLVRVVTPATRRRLSKMSRESPDFLPSLKLLIL